MPRRNRQKLHRELRLRAEARQARRRARRCAQRTQADRLARVVQSVLANRPRPASEARLDTVVASVSDLLKLASVGATERKRVQRICVSLGRRVPALCGCQFIGWYLLLARVPWARAPETFDPPTGSIRRKRDAFARHLLARFPVPTFLLRALDQDPLPVARVPVEDGWAVGILAHVGQGGSVRAIVGSDLLPMPLTRRMAHAFLGAPARSTPIQALRRAQVTGFGGSLTLARALLGTRLSELRGSDLGIGEPFWHTVIEALCARPGLASLSRSELDRVLAWIEVRQRLALADGTSFSLKGRTTATMRRDASAWLGRQIGGQGAAFRPSGLMPWWDVRWAMVEISTPNALAQEGVEMQHCARMYRKLITKNKVSLWSLRCGGRRVATVEVALGAMAIVQAKGKANRACTADEREAVLAFAAQNRLAVRSW